MLSMDRLKHKRIYEIPEQGDGCRVLVDRLWPRGVRKETAAVDVWLKDIAPSSALRRWFNHDSTRFEPFRVAYEAELQGDDVHRKAVAQMCSWLSEGPVTMVYAAKRFECSHTVVLHDYLVRLIQDVRP